MFWYFFIIGIVGFILGIALGIRPPKSKGTMTIDLTGDNAAFNIDIREFNELLTEKQVTLDIVVRLPEAQGVWMNSRGEAGKQ